MNEQIRPNAREWTVSQLSAALRKTVEDAFGYVRVRGEISGCKIHHSSGHCYFALKDESAKIDAVLFRTALARLRIKPEEGLEVVVTGRLTTYPGKSSYQIVVETLEPAGIGALMGWSAAVITRFGHRSDSTKSARSGCQCAKNRLTRRGASSTVN